MRIIKISATIIAIGLFMMACSSNQPQQTANIDPYTNDAAPPNTDQNDYWARDNLDLQRVGNLLERSNNPREFETYLNSNDGINNLDLNGDGYVDYISVDEYDDRGPNQRGLSLCARFGPDLIQEIATVVFYRDDFNSPGARIILTGNEQIYGDNYYYETNWADRRVPVVTLLFGDHDTYYRSPYYYDNYPGDYVVYQVVDTPVYRTRIERAYPAPIFIRANNSTIITRIKIKSPHNGKWMDKIYAKLAKPTKEQKEFRKNNPERPKIAKVDKGERKLDSVKPDKAPRDDRKIERENSKPPKPVKVEKHNDKPSKPAKAEKQNGRSPKPENGGKGKGKGKPN